MGPEALMKYVEPAEYIKRLAAAQGIDVLNLVKSKQQLEQEMQQQQQQIQAQEMTKQMGQLASAPLMDPSKNPQMLEEPEEEQPPTEE
jgi:23S rRNA pseudoU1915 N3-methylase RlmH